MNKEEFCELMKGQGKKINIKFKEEQLEKFYKYMNILLEWNENINLTAIIEPKEIILKHFIDSLTILKYLKDKNSMIDIGTGAGFPGIPIKIMREDVNITLVDSLNKRIKFLNYVISELNLINIEAIHSRIEDCGQNVKYREKFDIVTSRAVANLSTLAEYMIPMARINGQIVCMKGAECETELEQSQKAIKVLGGKIKKVEKIVLPDGENKRNIIIINKVKTTPKQYPRKAGKPSKEPIK